MVLDTEESVAAWIAERKKRWPTKQRVEEKQKKRQEAFERGEILEHVASLRGNKRRRTDAGPSHPNSGEHRGRGRGRGGSREGGPQGRQDAPAQVVTHHPLPQKPICASVLPATEEDSSSSDSDSDMDPEKDAISSKIQQPPSTEGSGRRESNTSEDGDKPTESLVAEIDEVWLVDCSLVFCL